MQQNKYAVFHFIHWIARIFQNGLSLVFVILAAFVQTFGHATLILCYISGLEIFNF